MLTGKPSLFGGTFKQQNMTKKFELIPKDESPKANLPATLDLSACTKKNIDHIAQTIITGIKDGYLDPVEEYSKAKAINDLSKSVMDGTKENVVKAMAGAKNYEHKGIAFQVKNGAKEYDFSDNPEWVKLSDQKDAIEEKMKIMQDLMKKAMDFHGVVDENGVVMPPAKISGGKADSLTVTIPKQ